MTEYNHKEHYGLCCTCEYFAETFHNDTCRKYPPDKDGFPQVKGDQWCGEYSRNDNKLRGNPPKKPADDMPKSDTEVIDRLPMK